MIASSLARASLSAMKQWIQSGILASARPPLAAVIVLPRADGVGVLLEGRGRGAEQAEAHLRHALGRAGIVAGAVEVDALPHRLRPERHLARDRGVRALVAEGLAAQQPLGDLVMLAKEVARVGHVDGARIVFDPGHAAPQAEMQVGVGHQAQHRHLFREPHRLVPGQHDDRGAEPQIGAGGRHVAQEEERRRRGVVVGEVVFQNPDAAETQ